MPICKKCHKFKRKSVDVFTKDKAELSDELKKSGMFNDDFQIYFVLY